MRKLICLLLFSSFLVGVRSQDTGYYKIPTLRVQEYYRTASPAKLEHKPTHWKAKYDSLMIVHNSDQEAIQQLSTMIKEKGNSIDSLGKITLQSFPDSTLPGVDAGKGQTEYGKQREGNNGIKYDSAHFSNWYIARFPDPDYWSFKIKYVLCTAVILILLIIGIGVVMYITGGIFGRRPLEHDLRVAKKKIEHLVKMIPYPSPHKYDIKFTDSLNNTTTHVLEVGADTYKYDSRTKVLTYKQGGDSFKLYGIKLYKVAEYEPVKPEPIVPDSEPNLVSQ
jgi:hypothetical protein